MLVRSSACLLAHAGARRSAPCRLPPPPAVQATRIVAVVNGDVISNVRCRQPCAAVRAVHRPADDAGRAGSAEAADHRASSSTRSCACRRCSAARSSSRQGDRRRDPRHRGAQRPAGGCAAAEARGGRRRPAHADRSDPHAARLDPGAARAAWRPGEDHRRRSRRAAAAAGAAGRQAGIPRRRDLHSG